MKTIQTRIQKYCFAFISYDKWDRHIWKRDIFSPIFPFADQETAEASIKPLLHSHKRSLRIANKMIYTFRFRDVKVILDYCFVFSVKVESNNQTVSIPGVYLLIPYNKFKNVRTTLGRAHKLIIKDYKENKKACIFQ